jgi:hypothetical protein
LQLSGSSASVEIEDLPSGLNKISAEHVAVGGGRPVLPCSERFRDEVVFFVHPVEEEPEQAYHEENMLRLLPPSAPVIIGR